MSVLTADNEGTVQTKQTLSIDLMESSTKSPLLRGVFGLFFTLVKDSHMDERIEWLSLLIQYGQMVGLAFQNIPWYRIPYMDVLSSVFKVCEATMQINRRGFHSRFYSLFSCLPPAPLVLRPFTSILFSVHIGSLLDSLRLFVSRLLSA